MPAAPIAPRSRLHLVRVHAAARISTPPHLLLTLVGRAGIADVPTGAYSESALHHVFSQFAQFGNTKQQADDAMDNAKFAKFARDTKLVGRTLTATDVDLIFAKCVPPCLAAATAARRLPLPAGPHVP